MSLEIRSTRLCHQWPDSEGGNLDEQLFRLPLGAFQEILEERLKVEQVFTLNDKTPFRMNSELEISPPIPKHKQDDRRRNLCWAIPSGWSVLQGAEPVGAAFRLDFRSVQIHWLAAAN